jgi:Protein of unknown function (DUF1194)
MRWRSLLKQTFLATVALILVSSSSSSAPAGVEEVDLKLVIATDVSRSINREEALLQREGTAAAFSSPEVVKAIESGSLGRIAVAMIDFSSPEFNRIVLNWEIVHDQASAASFAEKVRNAPRTPGRRTSVSSALELGALLIQASEKDIVATRRVIDVSGDGPNNDGDRISEAHEKTIAQGIIVNGLPIMDEDANGYYPDLDRYYANCVIGGRGAFVIVVKSFKDFGTAMRRKLILEISEDESRIKQAETGPKNPLLVKVQAPSLPLREGEPQVLRAPKEYPQGCDYIGGFGFGGF